MKESDLYPPVRDWLKKNGYEVHAEIFETDVIGLRDLEITAVELKLGLSGSLIEQLVLRAAWADYVMGAVSWRPGRRRPPTGGFRYRGFGLLLVSVAPDSFGKVKLAVKPKPQPWMWHKRHDYRLKKLLGREPAQEHELAGLPSCPALREQRLLRPQKRIDIQASHRTTRVSWESSR